MSNYDHLTDAQLIELLPDAIADDLRPFLSDGDDFVRRTALIYLTEDDPAARADMVAFHGGNGPEMLRQSALKHDDGTPTAADLEAQMGGDA